MILAWSVVAVLAKKPEPTPPAPVVDFWSDAGLAAEVAALMPAIERRAGRSWTSAPSVTTATPDAFGAMWVEEQRLLMSAVLRDTPPELREQQLDRGFGLVPGVLGKYAVFEDRLYLCRDAISSAVVELGHEPSEVEAFARTILIHELVHALHDQQTDLAAQIGTLADLDALYAVQGTSEGLAAWVTDQVAADLGLGDRAIDLQRLQGFSPEGLQEPGAWPTYSSYGLGRDAMRWHFEHGGFDRVWDVALHPPATSAGVYRPERWSPTRPAPDLDYLAVLRGAEQKLTAGAWIVGLSLLGEYDLRGEASVGGDDARLVEVLSSLREAWKLDGTMPDRTGQIRVMVFTDPSGPKRYLELLTDQEKAVAALTSRDGREIDIAFAPFPDAAGDATVLRSSRRRGADGVGTERHAAWVARGDTLVVVTADGFRPGLRLGWTVDEVFARLDAARGAK